MAKTITAFFVWLASALMLFVWPLFPFAGYFIGHCGRDPVVRAIATYALIVFEVPVLAIVFTVGVFLAGAAIEAWRSSERRNLFIKRWVVSAFWAALISVVAGLLGLVSAAGGCSWGW